MGYVPQASAGQIDIHTPRSQILGTHTRKSWTKFVTSGEFGSIRLFPRGPDAILLAENQRYISNEAIDLLDKLLRCACRTLERLRAGN